MNRSIFGLAAVGVLIGVWVARGADQKKSAISKFMVQKLEHSQKVLEGLALDDFEMIATNAKAMNTLSNMADWQVLPSLEYARQSQEFQHLTSELTRMANDKNLDGATLAYVQLTINCVNCHKYVRSVDKRE